MNNKYYWWGVIFGMYVLYLYFMLYLAWEDLSVLFV